MPKYNVFFTDEAGSSQIGSSNESISANDTAEAVALFLDKVKTSESKYIAVSGGIFSSIEIHNNPKFIDYEAGGLDLDLDLLNSGNIDTNSEIKSAGRKQYKVMTQKDKWFSQKFDPERLEQALNAYAREGWVVKSICTASIAGFGQNREELIVIFER